MVPYTTSNSEGNIKMNYNYTWPINRSVLHVGMNAS